MRPEYNAWLVQQRYDSATVQAQLYRVARVEEHYGNLDEHYDRDRLQSVIEQLRYTAEDKRRNRPNPSKIPFQGDIRNNCCRLREGA